MPDGENAAAIGSDNEEAKEGAVEEAEPVNFMTRLYEDENFVQEKALLEEQIMEATQATAESKNFI